MVYTVTYEGTRHLLAEHNIISNSALRSSIGGGLASAAALLVVVPSDIVSQHMMVFERRRVNPGTSSSTTSASSNMSKRPNSSSTAPNIVDSKRSNVDTLNLRQLIQREPKGRFWWLITREIYRRDGLYGFYRGYPASLICYAPSSAALWALYIEFTSKFFIIFHYVILFCFFQVSFIKRWVYRTRHNGSLKRWQRLVPVPS